MKLSGSGKLLRIFIGESDIIEHQPLYELIVRKAHEAGMAGATVLRGVEGYGAASRVIHTAKILRLSEDLPIVVEIADTEEKVRAFIPMIESFLEQAAGGGLVTLEDIEIIKYSHGS